jgi:hypothetical protein
MGSTGGMSPARQGVALQCKAFPCPEGGLIGHATNFFQRLLAASHGNSDNDQW